MKQQLAQTTGKALTWGLRHIAGRPAGNLPGKVALKIDPQLITHLMDRISCGTLMVVGTNGKTSTNNLIADAFERAGFSVVCNRGGDNLATGIASTLVQSKGGDWGVFESDELWLARSLPQIKPDYVLLLNLFRDQLDRCGEIDRIQTSIASALEQSPETTLIFNADDPQCTSIALSVPNPRVAFGTQVDMGLSQNTVADAQMCQRCEHMVHYRFRQYGQLGDYHCESCGFERPPLDFAVTAVDFGGAAQTPGEAGKSSGDVEGSPGDGMTMMTMRVRDCREGADGTPTVLHSPSSSPYLVYNLLAAFAICRLVGISDKVLQEAITAFDPKNGRLQRYEIDGRPVLLNLAKNPTGFNLNLRIIERDHGPKAVGFFINDKVADGHDISWIWDIDFEELAASPDAVVFAGGTRKNDVQVRLKYAGITSELVDSAEDMFARISHAVQLPKDAGVYVIANYTALPAVHESLDGLSAKNAAHAAPQNTAPPASTPQGAEHGSAPRDATHAAPPASTPVIRTSEHASEYTSERTAEHACEYTSEHACERTPLVIAHMFPDLLNLYGDGGNVRILTRRLEWRNLPYDLRRIAYGDNIDFSEVDLVFLGGGPDREQKLAGEELMRLKSSLTAYVEDDGVLLAICGGFQILGKTWLLGDDELEGLSILNMETRRPGTSADRLTDNMVLSSPLAKQPVVGYENHAGRTYLGSGEQPFGKVISKVGHGNNEESNADGILYKQVIGSYSHGPLLSKNPEIADHLLQMAFERHAKRTGTQPPQLVPLPDKEELAANKEMLRRLGVL